jgi:hypothetical protein
LEVNMSTSSFVKLAAGLSLGAALAACAGLPPGYGQIYGQRYFKAPIDTYAVQIIRVDNRDTTDNPTYVDPGLRKITVQGPPDGAHRLGEQRSIELQVAPCTRYYLVAQKANRLMTDFTVKVDYQEAIGGCNAVAMK